MLRKGVKAPDGRYVPAWYSKAHLTTGKTAITIYAKRCGKLPRELGAVQNDTDMQTDYFESDKIRFYLGSPEYTALLPFAEEAR